MGKLFTKILRASQDRVIRIVNEISNPIKEAYKYDTPNELQITRKYSLFFGETLFRDG
jgi:hypothetical protein